MALLRAILRKLKVKEHKDDLEGLDKTSKSHRIKYIFCFYYQTVKSKNGRIKMEVQLNLSEFSLRRWAKIYSESGLQAMVKFQMAENEE